MGLSLQTIAGLLASEVRGSHWAYEFLFDPGPTFC